MGYNFNTIDGLFKPNYNVYKPSIITSESKPIEPVLATYKMENLKRAKTVLNESDLENTSNDQNQEENASNNNENTSSDFINRLKDFIRKEEGFRSKAYKDGKYYSIGYGFNNPKYKEGDFMTLEEAEDELEKQLKYREAKYIQRFGDKWRNLTDNQKIALMSFGYNTGDGNILNGNIAKYLDAGDLEQVKNSLNIVTAGGIYNPGLDARRKRERALFDA